MIRFIEPATEVALIDAARFKAENGIESSDEAQDALIDQHIGAASLEIASACGRANFGLATAEERFHIGQMREGLWLSHWPVSSIISVTADGSALSPDEYELAGERRLLRLIDGRQTIWSNYRVLVTYTGGYSLPDGCPADLAGVALEKTAASWAERGRDGKIKAEEIPGVQRLEYWVGSVLGMSAGLSERSAAVLMNYRNFAF